MALDRLYLTVGRERHDERGYLSIISMGSVQRGDLEDMVRILAVTVLPNMKAAKKWFRQMSLERPWETRQ